MSTASTIYRSDEDGEIEEGGIKSSGFRDADDHLFTAYGHPAERADRRAITMIVKRYRAATAARDARRACSVMIPALVKAVAVDYDQTHGRSRHLRGGRTCEGGMRFLFKRYHSEMSVPVTVTGVRVRGNHAYALIGSAELRAGYVTLQRIHGTWGLDVLLVLGIS